MTDRARDAALAALVARVPYIAFLGIRFDRCGDELTASMPFQPRLIGNPVLPALHGGATAAFLEVAAIISLGWQGIIDTDGSDEGMLRPSHSPSTTCAPASRATPSPAPASPVRAAASPLSMSRAGKTSG